MKLNQHLKDWKQTLSQRFSHLSLPQVSGLATWSFGVGEYIMLFPCWIR
ncbi:MAG: hypothetical protein AB4368_31050 [Xenococcaceae cyanobacterium]